MFYDEAKINVRSGDGGDGKCGNQRCALATNEQEIRQQHRIHPQRARSAGDMGKRDAAARVGDGEEQCRALRASGVKLSAQFKHVRRHSCPMSCLSPDHRSGAQDTHGRTPKKRPRAKETPVCCSLPRKKTGKKIQFHIGRFRPVSGRPRQLPTGLGIPPRVIIYPEGAILCSVPGKYSSTWP